MKKNSSATQESKSPVESAEFDIIVPTHNKVELTIRCINALYGATVTPFHLIVVDDSSDDEPAGLDSIFFERLQKKWDNITFIHSDEPYKCGNQIFNVGLKHAKNKFVATVMNSITAEPGWDAVALRFMEVHPEVGTVGLKCLVPWGPIESAGIGFSGIFPIDLNKDHPSHRFTTMYECPAAQWAFAIHRKEAIMNLEEDIYNGFVGWDDIDNNFVVRKRGWKIFYCGYGAGFHEPKATRGDDSARAQELNHENMETFFKRWGYWKEYKRLTAGSKKGRSVIWVKQ